MKDLSCLIKRINQFKITSCFILEKLFVMAKKYIGHPDLKPVQHQSCLDTES